MADNLIEFIALGGGRVANPTYDPGANDRTRRPHRIGEGNERSVPLSQIISPQATVHGRAVNSMAGKYKRGTLNHGADKVTLQRSGPKFIVHDGNHHIAAAIKAGKRRIKALVQ